jgi:hypothetical protein
MSHRCFTDSSGQTWDVWTVVPTRVERRAAEAAMSRPAVERREHDELRAHLNPRFTDGWLVFQTKREKRRLAPYPDTWEQADDAELEQLCQRATEVQPPRRLVE